MNLEKPQTPYDLRWEVTLRIVASGREPEERVFNGGSSAALHPAHLMSFMASWPDVFDAMAGSHCKLAVLALLNEVARQQDQAKAVDTGLAALVTPDEANQMQSGVQFGSPELELAIATAQRSTTTDPTIAKPLKKAA